MKTVFITGISSGIGKALTEAFLKNGDLVIGTVRDEKSVQDLRVNFPDRLHLFKLDLSDLRQIDLISKSLDQILNSINIKSVDVLINNAGVALAAPFEYQNFNEVQDMIQINVLALMKVTQVLLPFIKKSKNGRIVQVSSVSGENGTPFLAGYCASKHAVEGFSESLRRELYLQNIKVVVVGPGSVQTPIWDKGFEKIKSLYNHTEYKDSFGRFIQFAQFEKNNALPVAQVAQVIWTAATVASPKYRYAPVPRALTNYWIPKLIPQCIFEWMNRRALGLSGRK